MRNRLRQIRRRLSQSRRRVVTLEINSSSLRLVEVKGTSVTKWASQPLDPGIFENGVVTRPRDLILAIRYLMKSSGTKARKITASVNGLYSLSRIISIPAPPAGVMLKPETVLEKAREVLPIPEEELYLTWQTIATSGDEHQVLIVGVPKEVIDGEVKALRGAGMNPHILGLKALALIQAVKREQALILNIEPATIDIILITDGVVQSIHTTAWQAATLPLEDMAEHLAVTLALTVAAHNTSHPGSPLDPATPLFITGEMSGDIELVEAVHARVTYPLEPLLSPLEYPPHLPVAQYAVNIGLAAQPVTRRRKPGVDTPSSSMMNILPKIYLPWRPTARQVLIFLAIVAIIGLLYPAYNLITEVTAKTARLKTRYDLVNNELNRRQAELAKREPMQKFLVAYQTTVDMGGGFIENIEVIKEKAREFGIEVPGITHGGETITITTGEAANVTAFRNFVVALRESGRFAAVTPPNELYPWPLSGTITLTTKK